MNHMVVRHEGPLQKASGERAGAKVIVKSSPKTNLS